MLFRTKLSAMAAVVALGATFASAQDLPTVPGEQDVSIIPRVDLFGNPERAGGQLSPDGTRMSFVAPVDGVLNVWVGPAGDFDAAKPITKDTGRGVRIHGWAPNGDQLFYLQDRGGDENFHLYLVDLETGEETDLSPFDGARAQPIAGSFRHPDRYLVGINNRDARVFDVYEVDLTTGERKLVIENPGFAGWMVDDDLNVRFGAQPSPDGGQTLVKPTEEGGWEPFLAIAGDDALSSQPLQFNDTGDAFYMLDSRDRNFAALNIIDAETGEVRETLVEPKGADISNVIFDPETNEPIAYATNRLRAEWTHLNKDGKKAIKAIEKALEGDWSVTSQTRDNSQWLVAEDKPDAPGRVWLFDREDRDLQELYTSRSALADAPLQTMFAVDIEARDGLMLPAYYTLPPGSDPNGDGVPDAPVEMVLDVHGGPWARDSYGYASTHQWLANRGYAVMSVNFRGSTGLGKDFVNAGNKEWGKKMHDDLLDAVAWAEEKGVAKPGSTAIMGGSYGGYATLAALAFTPDAFICGVDIVGPSNLNTLLASIPPYWEPLKRLFAIRVGDPESEEGQALLKARSPLYSADKISKPLLIAQGANDPRVKQAESEQIVDAMKANGLPVTYLLFPDEGHGFARPPNRLAFFAVAEQFLGDCLGGRSEPIGDAFQGSSLTVKEGASHVPGLSEALEDHAPVTAG